MERISTKFSFCGRLLPIIGELTQLLRYRNISHETSINRKSNLLSTMYRTNHLCLTFTLNEKDDILKKKILALIYSTYKCSTSTGIYVY